MIETIMKVGTIVLASTGTTLGIVDLVKVNKVNKRIEKIDSTIGALDQRTASLVETTRNLHNSITALKAWNDTHITNCHK